MELTLSQVKTNNNKIFSLLPTPTAKQALIVGTQKMGPNRGNMKMRCSKEKTSLVVDLERELEDIEREGKWWRGRKSSGGMVELLECLEREAIMGEDEGKEPTDYNRRAQIFDKSSKVFQALKKAKQTQP